MSRDVVFLISRSDAGSYNQAVLEANWEIRLDGWSVLQ